MRIFLIVEMILKIMQKSGKTRPKLTVRDEDDLLFSLWIFLFFLQGLGQVRRRLRPVQPHVRGGHATLLVETVGRILQVEGEVREGGQSPAEDDWCGQASARTHIGITFNLTTTGA